MIDIIYRFVPELRREQPAPADAEEARHRLEAGNRAFAELLAAVVDAFLTPGNYLSLATSHALRSVVDRMFVIHRPGYRSALIESTILLPALRFTSARCR